MVSPWVLEAAVPEAIHPICFDETVLDWSYVGPSCAQGLDALCVQMELSLGPRTTYADMAPASPERILLLVASRASPYLSSSRLRRS